MGHIHCYNKIIKRKGDDPMNILWYLGVCSVYLGGALLIDQHREMRELKKQLAQSNEEPQPIKRNFRCHTI